MSNPQPAEWGEQTDAIIGTVVRLSEAAGRGVSPRKVWEVLKSEGRDISLPSVGQRLRKLAEKGRIVLVGRARYEGV